MKKRFIWSAGVVTLGAIVAALSWGMWAMLAPPQGMYSNRWSEADLIRNRFPHYLVDPSRVASAPDDVLIPWTLAETKTRLVVVWVCWFVALILVFVWSRRGGSANKHLQPTPR